MIKIFIYFTINKTLCLYESQTKTEVLQTRKGQIKLSSNCRKFN